MILRAVVIADDGCDGDGIAEEKRHEDEAHVHQNTVGIHAVFLGNRHELHVIEYADERGRKVADHLARTVVAGLAEGAEVKARTREAQQRIVGIIRGLEEKGEIIILKGGKDDIIA